MPSLQSSPITLYKAIRFRIVSFMVCLPFFVFVRRGRKPVAVVIWDGIKHMSKVEAGAARIPDGLTFPARISASVSSTAPGSGDDARPSDPPALFLPNLEQPLQALPVRFDQGNRPRPVGDEEVAVLDGWDLAEAPSCKVCAWSARRPGSRLRFFDKVLVGPAVVGSVSA